MGLLVLLWAIAGCDTTKLTADSTSELFVRAAPAFEEYWDYDVAGDAAPATIVQLEGILRIVPDNQNLLLQLARAYTGYAFGWIEDEAEEAEFAGDFEKAEHLQKRARLMYLRATDLLKHSVGLKAKGLDKATKGGADELNAWLEKNFKSEDDAQLLLWTGYSWGSYVNMSKDDMEAVADLGYAKAFVRRSVELDPSHYNSAGLTFLGVATASAMAADLDEARGYFDEALTRTERGSLITHVNMARHYAVKKGDRELFEKLCNEVLEAGDLIPENRLANRIARRRAQRYLDHADDLF